MMMMKESLQKKYLKPTIRMIALKAFEILAESGDKDIPFDPGSGTGEALAPEDRSIWSEEYDSWEKYTAWEDE